MRQIQIRFGRYQPGQDPNRASLFVRVKYWEIIADDLSKAGWSWGCVSTVDSNRRTIFIADAHRGDGKRFIVRADEKLTAFVELERAIYEFAVDRLDSVSAAGTKLRDAKDKALQGQ